MPAPDDLLAILNHIVNRQHTPADLEVLRQALTGNSAQNVVQLGKYTVNIGQGQDIRIGDQIIYQGADAEAIRKILQDTLRLCPIGLVTDRNLSSHENFSDPRPSVGHWQGRETELAELQAELVKPAISLVGITGLGGFGKSTLAAKLYQEMTGFAGKFWLDATKQLSDFTHFACGAIAQFRYSSPEWVKSQYSETQLPEELVKVLQTKPYLVVIDNLETLLQPDGQWQGWLWESFFRLWLESGDHSKLLVTSRERPDLPKTKSYWCRLETGLSPAEGAALLVLLGIRGDEADLQQFVQSVGGFPLSLILAVGLLKEEEQDPQILHLSSYESIFKIKGEHRGEQQISVEDVFNQSFNRLRPKKLQRLLTGVTVYRGAFNASAAAALLPEEDVIEQDLQQLVKRSLLQELDSRDKKNQRQFQFQPQVLNYVKSQAGDLVEAHERAIAYYSSIAKPQVWQNINDTTEYQEIFYHWCQLKQYNQAFDTLKKYDDLLDLQGYHSLRSALYNKLLEGWQLVTKREDKAYLGQALTDLGNAYISLGENAKASECYQQSLEIAQEINNPHNENRAVCGLGVTYYLKGNWQESLNYIKKALQIAEEIEDEQGKANTLNTLGNVYYSQANWQESVRAYEQSLILARKIGDCRRQANVLGNLGNSYFYLGDLQRAIGFHKQRLEISREMNDHLGVASSLIPLSTLLIKTGSISEGLALGQEAYHLMLELISLGIPVNALPLPKWLVSLLGLYTAKNKFILIK